MEKGGRGGGGGQGKREKKISAGNKEHSTH
jgi:hypothetical protein